MKKYYPLRTFAEWMMLAALFCWGTVVHAGTVREPAVAGQFYPGNRQELTVLVDGYLSALPSVDVRGRIRAVVAPHAGYRYSGALAGAVFSQIPIETNRVIIMAPSHRVPLRGGGSITDVDAYRTPLGDVQVDPVADTLRRDFRFFGYAAKAHAEEHALEVMLPFLQRRLKAFALIPIVLGKEFDAHAMAKALQPLSRERKSLFVASTDLSHYHDEATARKLDQDCIRTILDLDIAGLDDRELCGKEPVRVLLHLAKLNNWKPVLINSATSASVTGDKGRVVGYAAIAFVDADGSREMGIKTTVDNPDLTETIEKNQQKPEDYKGEMFSDGEQKLLLDLARRSIMKKLKNEKLPPLPGYSPTLTEKLGCFVTLKKYGKLRGCIGNIWPTRPLASGVQANAISAAFQDPRFAPVKPGEMDALKIEISVLTVPREIEYNSAVDLLEKLRPGVHGVVLTQGASHRSTYLPQVWDEITRKEVFLSMLCRKGGMPLDAWKNPGEVKVEVYEAFSFAE